MKGIVRQALRALAMLCLLTAPAFASAAVITILHVNDTHSHLDAIGPKDHRLDGTLGGLTKAAGVISALRATSPNALFVHAGDVFQEDLYFYAALGPGGTPLLSVPELQLLAGLGLDAMAVGNHELHFGSATYAQVLQAAFTGLPRAPQVLTANIDLAKAGLAGLVQANTVKEIGGVRVGFFGLTTPDALIQDVPFLAATPEALAPIAQAQVDDLHRQRADVVVCLSHFGLDVDEALASSVAGLDAIIGGHDHAIAVRPVFVRGPSGKRIPIVRAGEFYKWVGKLSLSVEKGRVSFAGYELVPVDAAAPRIPAVAAVVDGLKAGIDQRYGEDFWHERIAFALADVAKDVPDASPQRDAPVGDLVTDALRAAGGTDVALTVNGFFTEGLTRGFLVRDDAFRIVGDGIDPTGIGLGFPLYRIEITGQNLLAALATTSALGGDLFLQVSGLRYVFDSRTGQLVSAHVHGCPIDPARTYSATVSLGLVAGLGQLPNVQLAAAPQPLGITEYEAVRDWMKRLGVVLYLQQGRIVDVAKE